MDGRWFSGRKIEASFFSGRQRFRKGGHVAEDEDQNEEKQRLEDFEKWLMAEGETQ
jgi:HIV Tat-specific factor 1